MLSKTRDADARLSILGPATNVPLLREISNVWFIYNNSIGRQNPVMRRASASRVAADVPLLRGRIQKAMYKVYLVKPGMRTRGAGDVLPTKEF